MESEPLVTGRAIAVVVAATAATIALVFVGSAGSFVFGRWCAQVMGWY